MAWGSKLQALTVWMADRLPWLLAFYFAIQTGRRLLEPHTLGLDEAEQIIMTQGFAWGYGSQPPLYTWLQMILFNTLGVSVLSLALLKNILFFLTFYLMFRVAEAALGDRVKAAAATLSLFFIPQIAWESQRALAHTLLVVLAAAATLWCFLRLMQRRSVVGYALLGAAIGAGCLGKYNFPLFALGLFASALSTRSGREAVLDRRMALVSLPVAAVAVLPTALWSIRNPELALARVDKLAIRPDLSLLETWAQGAASVVSATVAFSALCIAIYVLFAFVPPRRPWPRGDCDLQSDGMASSAGAIALQRDIRRMLLLLPAISLGVVLVFQLASGATEFKDRWLQPVLFSLPLACFIALDRRLDRPRQAGLAAVGALLGIVAAVALLINNRFPQVWGPARAAAPFDVIAQKILETGFSEGTLLSPSNYVAGNLLFQLPGARGLTPEYLQVPIVYRPPILLALEHALDHSSRAGLERVFHAICETELPGQIDDVVFSAPYEGWPGHEFAVHVAALPGCGQ
jgi:4-amino-4-deoxy-L-arabinose transferase-like glycosyltransferase